MLLSAYDVSGICMLLFGTLGLMFFSFSLFFHSFFVGVCVCLLWILLVAFES